MSPYEGAQPRRTSLAREPSPLFHQMSARSTRPPSRGYPGIRLKAASERLIYPSQSSMAIHGSDGAPPTARAASRQIPPMAALVSGPTNAIQNSSLALVGFFSI